MAKVGQASPSYSWRSWAASRRQVVELAAELSGHVSRALGEEPSAEIELPQYERRFESPEEFLENVDEREWAENTRSWSLRLWAPAAHLSVRVSREFGDAVWLTVHGGSRPQRNSLLPDLRLAVDRLSRKRPAANRVMIVGGGVVVAVVFCLGLWGMISLLDVIADADWSQIPLTAAFLGLVALVTVSVVGLGALLYSTRRRWMPGVELLPDDGVSRWERIRTKVVVGLGVIAAVVTIVTGVVALLAGVV